MNAYEMSLRQQFLESIDALDAESLFYAIGKERALIFRGSVAPVAPLKFLLKNPGWKRPLD